MHINSLRSKFAALAAISLSIFACDSATVGLQTGVVLEDGDAFQCAPIEVDLSGTRLLGRISTEATETVSATIPDGVYDIHLHYEDEDHNKSNQPDQLGEQWFAEGIDEFGDVRLTTINSNDLPGDVAFGTTYVGRYFVEGVVAIVGRHGSIGSEYNSIEPTLVELFPAFDNCLDPI